MTSRISAIILNSDSVPVSGAVCSVKLNVVSMSNSWNIDPNASFKVADSNGYVYFDLLPINNPSQSYYIFDSFDPVSGNKIHSEIKFTVNDQDSDLFDVLIYDHQDLDFHIFKPFVTSGSYQAIIHKPLNINLGDRYDRAGIKNQYISSSEKLNIIDNVGVYQSNEYGLEQIEVICKTSGAMESSAIINVYVVPDDYQFEFLYFNINVVSPLVFSEYVYQSINVG